MQCVHVRLARDGAACTLCSRSFVGAFQLSHSACGQDNGPPRTLGTPGRPAAKQSCSVFILGQARSNIRLFQHGTMGFGRAFSAQLSCPHKGTRRWGHVGHAIETQTTTTACARCERTVWVDGATKELPLGALRWDKRDGGAALWHGTCRHCVSLSMTGSNHPPALARRGRLGELTRGPTCTPDLLENVCRNSRAPSNPLVLHRAWSEPDWKLDSGRTAHASTLAS